MRKLLESHRIDGNGFPLIGGHRGCSCAYQENSLLAMEEGLREGADYLEIDVQLTRDHVPVIFHDISTLEKTGLPGLVQDHDYAELFDAYQLPTLKETLEWGKASKAYFALELKSYASKTRESNLALLPLLDEAVKKFDMYDQVEAFGIDYGVLSALKRINPSFEIGLIVPFVPSDPVRLMKEMDAMIYLSYAYNLTGEAIRSLQKNGFYVSGAILKERELIDYSIKERVDMFEFDFPGEFKGRK